MYIYYEEAKCYLQLESDNLKKARNKATKCLQLAKEINNNTWTVNALILLVSIEFQLDDKPKCCTILYKALEIANMLQVPGVIIFLDKVSKCMHIIIVTNTNYNFLTLLIPQKTLKHKKRVGKLCSNCSSRESLLTVGIGMLNLDSIIFVYEKRFC